MPGRVDELEPLGDAEQDGPAPRSAGKRAGAGVSIRFIEWVEHLQRANPLMSRGRFS